MRTVGEVRRGESALFVCHIPDGEKRHHAEIRHDVVRFGGGGWHGGLRGFFSLLCIGRIDADRAGTWDPSFIQRKSSLRGKCNRKTIRRQVSLDGTA